jgi:peptide/nickel transport system permease protein
VTDTIAPPRTQDAIINADETREATASVVLKKRSLRRPPIGLIVCFAALATVVTAALAPGLFTSTDPYEIFYGAHLQAPSAEHLFGTDNLGRDLFARVVYGARISLTASVAALTISFVVGGLLGLLAGAAGRRADVAVMRLTDLLLSIPSLLMSLAIVAALGFGTRNVAIAVGIAGIAPVARLTRASVLVVARSAYVEASRLSGVSAAKALRTHVLPNAISPVFAFAALEFGASIIAIASLSFLGVGVEPPEPEWGALVSDGRSFLATAWWMTTMPGLVVTAVVIATNGIYLHFQRKAAKVQ